MLSLVEVDRYDASAAVGKLEGLDVVVADAASMVGKRVKVRVERVLDGRAYAVLVRKTKEAPEPLTAEGEAEKPTRKPPARKGAGAAKEAETVELEETVVAEPEAEAEAEAEPEDDETAETDEAPKPKKKTRRGSRGGRKRKKPATAQTTETAESAEAETVEETASEEAPEPARGVTIHVPGEELGRDGTVEPVDSETPERGATDEPTAAEAAQEASEVLAEPGRASAASPPALAAKKRTRRGSRGGKNRKKKPATAAANGSEEPAQTAEAPEAEPASTNGDFEYVPMSEWADELDRNR
jgi:hypothetical protein